MLQTVWKMQERSARLALRSLAVDVRVVFETSGFDCLIEIHPSPDEAISIITD